jgi:hypothetical protein
VSVASHKVLNQLLDFYEIQLGDHAIEGDLSAITFNPVASTIKNCGCSDF